MGHLRLKFEKSKTPAPDSVFSIRMIPLPKPIEEEAAVEAADCHVAGPYTNTYSKAGIGTDFFREQPKVGITSDGLFAVSSDTGGSNGGYVTVHMKTNVGWAELAYLCSPLSLAIEPAAFGHSCAIADSKVIVACWDASTRLAIFTPVLDADPDAFLTWTGEWRIVFGEPIESVAISRNGNVIVTWNWGSQNVNITVLGDDGIWVDKQALALTDDAVFGIAMIPDGSTIVVSTNSDVGGGVLRTSAISLKTTDFETWSVDGDPLIGSTTYSTSGVEGSGIAITPDESLIALGVIEEFGAWGAIVIFSRASESDPYVQTARLIPGDDVAGRGFGISLGISDDGNFIAAGSPLSTTLAGDNAGELFLIDNVRDAVGDTFVEASALEGIHENEEVGLSVACDACGNTIISQGEGGNTPTPFNPEVRLFESAP